MRLPTEPKVLNNTQVLDHIRSSIRIFSVIGLREFLANNIAELFSVDIT